MQHLIQIETFENNLQADVNKMWQSQQGSREVWYRLPQKINAVCFIDDEYHNLMFKSANPIDRKNIDNIDLDFILSGQNSYCIENIDGKVSMTLVRDYGETLVKITK